MAEEGTHRALLVGAGAVGARAARQLVSVGPLAELLVSDIDSDLAAAVAATIGEPVRAGPLEEFIAAPGDVVVLASGGDHRRLAERALEDGAHVVSVSDRPEDVAALLDLAPAAPDRARHRLLRAAVP